MRKIIAFLIISIFLSTIASAVTYSTETFETDDLNADPTCGWYTYHEEIGGNAGVWDANVSDDIAFMSNNSLKTYNSIVEFYVNSSQYTEVTLHYYTNTSHNNGGWIQLKQGYGYIGPTSTFLHVDDMFRYENGIVAPIDICNLDDDTWYKIYIQLNWTTNEQKITISNTTNSATSGWDRMYSITTESIQTIHYKDTGGHAEYVWFDDISLNTEAGTIIDNSMLVVGLLLGIVIMICVGFALFSGPDET